MTWEVAKVCGMGKLLRFVAWGELLRFVTWEVAKVCGMGKLLRFVAWGSY